MTSVADMRVTSTSPDIKCTQECPSSGTFSFRRVSAKIRGYAQQEKQADLCNAQPHSESSCRNDSMADEWNSWLQYRNDLASQPPANQVRVIG